MSLALTAIYSQTFNSILEKLFQQNGIDSSGFSSYHDLLIHLEESPEAELIFISRETLQSAEFELSEAIAKLKVSSRTHVYVMSSNKDFKDIERHIMAGATDVILTSKLEQIENILKSFRIHLDTVNTEQPYRVLLVEDSESLVGLVKSYFETHGMAFYSAASVKAGLEILKVTDIDVILCDIVLEGDITGIELVRQAYQNSKWRDVPILVTSSFSDSNRQKHFYRLGVRDVIKKPYDIEVLYLKAASLAKEHRVYQLLIEERKQIEAIAFTDTETGLRNRTYLKYEYGQWILDHPENSMALLIEVDDYQQIKREYGLNQCEFALRQAASSLQDLAPDHAIIAHLTGEQFLMLVPNITEAKTLTLAQEIIKDVNTHWVIEGTPLSVCIGITSAHSDITLNDLLKIADGCLYLAKEEGKGQFETTF